MPSARVFRALQTREATIGPGEVVWVGHHPSLLHCPARCVTVPLTTPLCVLLVISVNHPLDYEQVANGVIYLTVMAKDAGNPPLNSTVPVTIEVFVSMAPDDSAVVPLRLPHHSASNPSTAQ